MTGYVTMSSRFFFQGAVAAEPKMQFSGLAAVGCCFRPTQT